MNMFNFEKLFISIITHAQTQHTLKHSVTTVCRLKSLRYVDKGSKLLTASEVQHIDLGDAKFL